MDQFYKSSPSLSHIAPSALLGFLLQGMSLEASDMNAIDSLEPSPSLEQLKISSAEEEEREELPLIEQKTETEAESLIHPPLKETSEIPSLSEIESQITAFMNETYPQFQHIPSPIQTDIVNLLRQPPTPEQQEILSWLQINSQDPYPFYTLYTMSEERFDEVSNFPEFHKELTAIKLKNSLKRQINTLIEDYERKQKQALEDKKWDEFYESASIQQVIKDEEGNVIGTFIQVPKNFL